jgi:putative ABC transport system ATP-binding protein
MIVLDQVRKTYRARSGPVTGLAGVQLGLEPRQLVCIHGPSGAGKTTLLMAIGGMLRPTGGRVAVADHDLYAMTSEQRTAFRARNIGFVFQMFHLVPYLSVLDNVWLAARREKGARQRAIDLLEQFGMGHRVAHRPAELSAGERQRTAIARALLNRPPVVLADEPTGNLDEENGAEVFRILAAYRDQGGTVLVVTHGPEGRRHADRVLSMRDGQIVDG